MLRNIFTKTTGYLKMNRGIAMKISECETDVLQTSANSASDKAELNAVAKIEANLFENSTLHHKPASMAKLLRGNPKIEQTRSAIGSIQNISNTRNKAQRIQQELEESHDSELGLRFVRLNMRDPLLSTLMMTVRSRKRRDKNREIVLEGRRLICEAIECRIPMKAIIFSQREELSLIKEGVQQVQARQATPVKIYKVPHHDLKMWSTLSTSTGLLAIFKRPSEQDDVAVEYKISTDNSRLPITVVCDNIREPNNLGSVIRTCAALPCFQVIVTRGCCDPWDAKALRGGCGGQFKVPIKDDIDWENIPALMPPVVEDDCCVFIAENNLTKIGKMSNSVDVVNYREMGSTGSHNVVIIGGESHGVSEQAYRFSKSMGQRGKCLYIPLANNVDSLNVSSALTVILYELRNHLFSRCTNTKTSSTNTPE